MRKTPVPLLAPPPPLNPFIAPSSDTLPHVFFLCCFQKLLLHRSSANLIHHFILTGANDDDDAVAAVTAVVAAASTPCKREERESCVEDNLEGEDKKMVSKGRDALTLSALLL